MESRSTFDIAESAFIVPANIKSLINVQPIENNQRKI